MSPQRTDRPAARSTKLRTLLLAGTALCGAALAGAAGQASAMPVPNALDSVGTLASPNALTHSAQSLGSTGSNDGSVPSFGVTGATGAVNLHADRTIIDWKSFSVSSSEQLNFNFNNKSDIVINRVGPAGGGSAPFTISVAGNVDGLLTGTSNHGGNIWFLAADGVLISGQVRAGGVLASTGSITDSAFLNSTTIPDAKAAIASGDARIDLIDTSGVVTASGAQITSSGAILLTGDSSGSDTASSASLTSNGDITIGNTHSASLTFDGVSLTSTSGGNISLGGGAHSGAISATGAVALNSAGTISETSASSIDATTLSGSSNGAVTLTGTNLVGTLASFSNSGAGGVALINGQALTVSGSATVDAGSGDLTLTTTSGGLSVHSGASLSAGGNVDLEAAGAASVSSATAGGDLTVKGATGASLSAASFTGSGAHALLVKATSSGDAVLGSSGTIGSSNAITTGAGTTDVTVQTAGGNVVVGLDSADVGASGQFTSLSATGGDVTATVKSGDVSIVSLGGHSLTVAVGGALSVTNQPTLTQNYSVTAGAFSGNALNPASTPHDFTIEDTGGSLTLASLSADNNLTIKVDAGDLGATSLTAVHGGLSITASGTAAVTTNATAAGDVSVTAGSAAVGAAKAGGDITIDGATGATLGAATLTGSGSHTLKVEAVTSGDAVLGSNGAITSSNSIVTGSGTTDVTVQAAGGNVVVGLDSADLGASGKFASLSATGGDATATVNTGAVKIASISGDNVTVTASAGQAAVTTGAAGSGNLTIAGAGASLGTGTATGDLTVNGGAGSASVTTSATATGGTVSVTSTGSSASVAAATAGGDITVQGETGASLASADLTGAGVHNLTVKSLTSGDAVLGATTASGIGGSNTLTSGASDANTNIDIEADGSSGAVKVNLHSVSPDGLILDTLDAAGGDVSATLETGNLHIGTLTSGADATVQALDTSAGEGLITLDTAPSVHNGSYSIKGQSFNATALQPDFASSTTSDFTIEDTKGDLDVSSTGLNVSLSAPHTLTVTTDAGAFKADSLTGTSGNVVVTANGGSASVGAGVAGGNLTVTGGGAALGTGTGGGDVTVDGGSGSASVTTSATATNGSVSVTSTGSSASVAAATAGGDITVTGATGALLAAADLTGATAHNLTIKSLTSGDAVLGATTAAGVTSSNILISGASDANTNIDIEADGASGDVQVNLYSISSGGLVLDKLKAAHGKAVATLLTGDLHVASATAQGDVTVAASGGSASLDSGSAGGNLGVSGAGATLGTGTAGGDVTVDGGSGSASVTTSATATNGNVSVTSTGSSASVAAATAGGDITVTGATGALLAAADLTGATAHNLTVKSLNSGDAVLGATTAGGVTSSNTLTSGASDANTNIDVEADGASGDVKVNLHDVSPSGLILDTLHAANGAVSATLASGDLHVGAATAHGDITVAASGGSAALDSGTAGGNLSVTGAGATLGTGAAGGDVTVDGGSGAASVTTSATATSGNVSVTSTGSSASAAAATAHGDITVAASGGSAALDSGTAGGNLSVTGAGATLGTGTAGGDVTVDGGSGAASVTTSATATSGNVSVTSTGSSASAAAATAHGDITVEGDTGASLASASLTGASAHNLTIKSLTSGDAVLGAATVGGIGVSNTLTSGASDANTNIDIEADGASGDVKVNLHGVSPNGLVLDTLHAAGGQISATLAAGDLHVANASAHGDVAMTAAGGSAALDSGTAGGNLSVTGVGASLGSGLAGGGVTVDGGSGAASVTTSATATNGSVSVTSTGSSASVASATAGGDITVTGATGALLAKADLTGAAAHNLTVKSLNSGDAVLGATTAGAITSTNTLASGASDANTNVDIEADGASGDVKVNLYSLSPSGLVLDTLKAAHGSVSATLGTGDLGVSDVTASGDIALQSLAGAVTLNSATAGDDIAILAHTGVTASGAIKSGQTIGAVAPADTGPGGAADQLFSALSTGQRTIFGHEYGPTNLSDSNGAQVFVQAQGGDINVSGPIEAGGSTSDVRLQSSGAINTGDVTAGQDVVFDAGSSVGLASGASTNNISALGRDVAIWARGGDLGLTSATAADDIALRAAANLTTGALSSGTGTDATGAADYLASPAAGAPMTVQGTSFDLTGGDVDAVAGGSITVTGQTTAAGSGSDARFQAASGISLAGVTAGQDVLIGGSTTGAGDVTSSGLLQAGRDVGVRAGDGAVSLSSAQAGDDVAILASAGVSVSGGLTSGTGLEGAGAADLFFGSLSSSKRTIFGAVYAPTNLSDSNASQVFVQAGGGDISVGGAVQAHGGASDVRLQATGAINTGDVTAGQDVVFDAGTSVGRGLAASNNITATGRDVAIWAHGGGLSLTSATGGDDVVLRAPSGQVAVAGAITAGAKSDALGAGDSLAGVSPIAFFGAPATAATADPTLAGGSSIDIGAQQVSVTGAVNAGADVRILAAGPSVGGGGALLLHGDVKAGQDVVLDATGGDVQVDGALSAGRDAALRSAAGSVQVASASAGGDLAIWAGKKVTANGALSATGLATDSPGLADALFDNLEPGLKTEFTPSGQGSVFISATSVADFGHPITGQTFVLDARDHGLVIGASSSTADQVDLTQTSLDNIQTSSVVLFASGAPTSPATLDPTKTSPAEAGDVLIGQATINGQSQNIGSLRIYSSGNVLITGALTPAGAKPVDLTIGGAFGSGWTPREIFVDRDPTGSTKQGSIGSGTGHVATSSFQSVTLMATTDIFMGSEDFRKAILSAPTPGSINPILPTPTFPPNTSQQLFVAAGALTLQANGHILQQNTSGFQTTSGTGIYLTGSGVAGSGKLLSLGRFDGTGPTNIDLYMSLNDNGSIISGTVAALSNRIGLLPGTLPSPFSQFYRVNSCVIAQQGACTPLTNNINNIQPDQLTQTVTLQQPANQDVEDVTFTGAGNEEIWRKPD